MVMISPLKNISCNMFEFHDKNLMANFKDHATYFREEEEKEGSTRGQIAEECSMTTKFGWRTLDQSVMH